MEAILMVAAAGFAVAGVVVPFVASCVVVRKILAKQAVREDLHREESRKRDENMANQELSHQRERRELSYLHREERAALNKRLADQEVYHQTERRELYERIQSAPVYTEPLLTGRVESGRDKGRSEAVDPDEMSPEELAKIGVLANSDGGFIDLRSKDKDLFETVKGLLFFREETEKEKKELADSA